MAQRLVPRGGWTKHINVNAKQRHWRQAVAVLTEMCTATAAPNTINYNATIAAWQRGVRGSTQAWTLAWMQALRLLDEMWMPARYDRTLETSL